MNVGWFVYVKFYVKKDGGIKPLVIGKSGSLLVNMYGSDLSFSIDVNDGPARRFLAEEGLEWCKTQIAVLLVESEEEAYVDEQPFSCCQGKQSRFFFVKNFSRGIFFVRGCVMVHF